MFVRKTSVQEEHLSFDHVSVMVWIFQVSHITISNLFCFLLCRSNLNSN